MAARPRSSTCSASSPTLETPGPSEARGECPQRPRSLEVVQLVRSRGWVLTWGPQRQEYAGYPQGGEVRGRRVCGQLSPRCLPVPGELFPAAPRGTEGGGSESRPRPGQWQSAELAALPLLFLRPEARSSGGWVGAKGRGRGRGGGRRPGGAFEGAGFGCAGPDTPSADRAKGWDQRGRERERKAG